MKNNNIEQLFLIIIDEKKIKKRLGKISKLIVDRQKECINIDIQKINWLEVEMEWFDYLYEQIIGKENE